MELLPHSGLSDLREDDILKFWNFFWGDIAEN